MLKSPTTITVDFLPAFRLINICLTYFSVPILGIYVYSYLSLCNDFSPFTSFDLNSMLFKYGYSCFYIGFHGVSEGNYDSVGTELEVLHVPLEKKKTDFTFCPCLETLSPVLKARD